jgi:hypothetical protein
MTSCEIGEPNCSKSGLASVGNSSGSSVLPARTTWGSARGRAAGVLFVLGAGAIGATVGKVGRPTVSPVVLALFALGCLILLGCVAALFWGLVLHVADRQADWHPERRGASEPIPPPTVPSPVPRSEQPAVQQDAPVTTHRAPTTQASAGEKLPRPGVPESMRRLMNYYRALHPKEQITVRGKLVRVSERSLGLNDCDMAGEPEP